MAIVIPMDNEFARKMFRVRSLFPEELDVYRNQLIAFRRKFGRDMGPEDPFFFDPDADTPQFRPPAEADNILDLIADMMAQAGIEPEAIYAFKRTRGLFPTEGRKLTAAEASEWNAAIQEYHSQLRRNATQ